MLHKVLVANRGEIALRVIRALREAGIQSVAVYSDVDRGALHVQIADEAVRIGPPPASESYLNIDHILQAARTHKVDGIHPGYGFLSENADFAAACEQAGIKFIGPPSDVIRRMGSKTEARKIARAVGAPLVPGTADAVTELEEARRIALQIGFPVMIKAAAGGGGKGMRRVDSEDELDSALRNAASEAERAFKSSEVYIEKLIVKPRHIEIQILADEHGHVIHLGERECSLQRRHQKVIEECPSPFIARHPEMRDRMGECAVRIAKAAGYQNAGTIEFLVDSNQNFYFLEMNTRLQVEHPITELATKIDIVQWQLRIADGQRLTLQQEDISWTGSAIECRIYAEDPENNFFPSPGLIDEYQVPSGPGIRLDSSAYPGWTVPIEYDPILAKLAVWAETREEALERMRGSLAEFHISGIRHNALLFRRIMRDPYFALGDIHTSFIDEFLARDVKPTAPEDFARIAALVALTDDVRNRKNAAPVKETRSRWLTEGRAALLR